jgi:hypothetical protein
MIRGHAGAAYVWPLRDPEAIVDTIDKRVIEVRVWVIWYSSTHCFSLQDLTISQFHRPYYTI